MLPQVCVRDGNGILLLTKFALLLQKFSKQKIESTARPKGTRPNKETSINNKAISFETAFVYKLYNRNFKKVHRCRHLQE